MTAFEKYAQSLGLSEDQYRDSKELRDWAVANRFDYYVPEILLAGWGLGVDPEDTRLL